MRKASLQHGLVTVEQLVELGFGVDARRHLVRRDWVREPGALYRLTGAPVTIAQQALAAVLASGHGGALGGESALAWWGLPGMRLQPAIVARPRDRADRRGSGIPREPTLLPSHHIVVLESIPTQIPARALFDFAGSKRGGADLPWWCDRVARAVDSAWAMRLVSGESLHCMLDEMAQRGRPGIKVMRGVLEPRGMDYVPPASNLESRLVQLLERAALPPMRRQVNTGDGVRWIGRVDFIDEVLPLIVEVQSERFHSSLIDQQLDADRIAGLRAAGFVVLEITDTDLWHRPREVVDRLRRARHLAAVSVSRAA